MAYIDKAQKLAKNKKANLAAAILGYRGVSEVHFTPLIWPISSPPVPAPTE
jgi:hypothetical protein